jgi:hypothetical protein
MKHYAMTALAGLMLAGASTAVSAQAPMVDCTLAANRSMPACAGGSNAVVNQGSGAVNPLGSGESSGTAGIGGSGTSAPRAPATTGSTTTRGVVLPPPAGGSNAVVNQGSGAVNPLGSGESSGSAGIGGSGTSAPRQ